MRICRGALPFCALWNLSACSCWQRYHHNAYSLSKSRKKPHHQNKQTSLGDPDVLDFSEVSGLSFQMLVYSSWVSAQDYSSRELSAQVRAACLLIISPGTAENSDVPPAWKDSVCGSSCLASPWWVRSQPRVLWRRGGRACACPEQVANKELCVFVSALILNVVCKKPKVIKLVTPCRIRVCSFVLIPLGPLIDHKIWLSYFRLLCLH